jgi:hypothetical protein
VYNQLLYAPVQAGKTWFSNGKNDPGQLIKAVVTRYRSDTYHATDHTRGHCDQL